MTNAQRFRRWKAYGQFAICIAFMLTVIIFGAPVLIHILEGI